MILLTVELHPSQSIIICMKIFTETITTRDTTTSHKILQHSRTLHQDYKAKTIQTQQTEYIALKIRAIPTLNLTNLFPIQTSNHVIHTYRKENGFTFALFTFLIVEFFLGSSFSSFCFLSLSLSHLGFLFVH